MGTIAVHEFIALDGVFEDPSWTFEFGFDPRMGETLAAITGAATAILLGRKHLRDVRSGLVDPHGRGRPGRAVLQRHPQVRRRRARAERRMGTLDAARRLSTRRRSAGSRTRSTASIYVSGSGTLVRGLLADGLVDDLHLFVYPVARRHRASTSSATASTRPSCALKATRRLRQRRRPPGLRPGLTGCEDGPAASPVRRRLTRPPDRRSPPETPRAGRSGHPGPAASSWSPSSTTRPWSSTAICSASRIVDRRCAMVIVVRPAMSRSRAAWSSRSVSLSRALVASSSTRTRGLRSRVRAMARRCFSPPENRWPRAPTTVSSRSGRRRDERRDLGGLEGSPQLVVGGLGSGEQEVVADRGVHEVGVLARRRRRCGRGRPGRGRAGRPRRS